MYQIFTYIWLEFMGNVGKHIPYIRRIWVDSWIFLSEPVITFEAPWVTLAKMVTLRKLPVSMETGTAPVGNTGRLGRVVVLSPVMG